MSYYPEPGSHISNKVKAVLDLPNYATKTKVNDLDVGKLKTVLVDLKKLSNVVENEVVKNRKFNTLKTKVTNLEKKSPDATTLIHINQ